MRRTNDFYPTPEFATRELLAHVSDIRGSIFEPCIGDGAIAKVIDGGDRWIYGNDIAPQLNCSFCGDASKRDLWVAVQDSMSRIDWVVTNPPFSVASKIIPLAYEFAEFGIAMLLRLSFLEPVEDRGAWLNEHPPTKLIVLPRISFTGNGKTDNVTCAWMVWEKSIFATTRIIVAQNPRFSKHKSTLFAETA
jgi:hypothetical protein